MIKREYGESYGVCYYGDGILGNQPIVKKVSRKFVYINSYVCAPLCSIFALLI